MGREDKGSANEDRLKALDAALSQIEKQYGKGSVMKLGDKSHMQVETIPTGSLSLDRWSWDWRSARCSGSRRCSERACGGDLWTGVQR